MKKLLTILVSICCLFASCKKEAKMTAEDYQRERKVFLDGFTSKLIGTWTFQRIDISAISNDSYQQKAGITKDTIITNLGTLIIHRCKDQEIVNFPICECTLTYKNSQIPTQFGLIADKSSNNSNGYFASFLFQTVPFPYPWEKPEDAFLQNSYLIGENYEIIQLNERDMVWKGQNAAATGVNRVELVKQP